MLERHLQSQNQIANFKKLILLKDLGQHLLILGLVKAQITIGEKQLMNHFKKTQQLK